MKRSSTNCQNRNGDEVKVSAQITHEICLWPWMWSLHVSCRAWLVFSRLVKYILYIWYWQFQYWSRSIQEQNQTPSEMYVLQIRSDSDPALTSIKSGRLFMTDITTDIFLIMYKMEGKRIVTHFLWVVAHIGVKGNELWTCWAVKHFKK